MKGIIFDKDGTLLKFDSFWRPVTEHAVEYILRERKAPPGMKDRMMEAAGLDSGICGLIYRGTYAQLSEAFQNVLEEGGMDADRMDELTLEAFRNSMEAGKIIPACADMDEVFRRLKESGVRIFLVTTENCSDFTDIHFVYYSYGDYRALDCSLRAGPAGLQQPASGTKLQAFMGNR